jgi:XTP/dITP diphosphohydrolase
MKQIVIASNNQGKLREFSTLLGRFGVEAIPQRALGVGEAPEPFGTFVENALAKARFASLATGLPALADDSGIGAVALGGAPGVNSARYAGEPKNDEANNHKLIEALAGHDDKRAYYTCVLVMIDAVDDPHPIIADAQWFGEIIAMPRGAGGFGYDPYFWLPSLNKTAAELSAEEKNHLSHRGLAMRALEEKLQQRRALSA